MHCTVAAVSRVNTYYGSCISVILAALINPNSRREGCSSELNHSYGWHLHRSGDNGLETWWQFLFGSSQGLDKVFFYNSLSRNVWKLSLQKAGRQFFIFISNFCESVVGRLAYLTLDRQTRVQIPCWDQFFFAFRNLFSFCGERLFSAIFKMGLIIFVAYQKLEKNVFEGIWQKKRKNYLYPDSNREPLACKGNALPLS